MWGHCEEHVRQVHVYTFESHPPPLPVKLVKKTLQARCKPNASYASLSCQRLKSFDTQVWILGGGPYVHITTSMWGHCEEHVKQCEEHVRWVWGTSEDNVRGSVRNMWGVGNLTTFVFLSLSPDSAKCPVSKSVYFGRTRRHYIFIRMHEGRLLKLLYFFIFLHMQ